MIKQQIFKHNKAKLTNFNFKVAKFAMNNNNNLHKYLVIKIALLTF